MSNIAKSVAIVGAGPAGLMAAEHLAAMMQAAGQMCAITIYDRMPSVARKFLLAGRGGLNLTHVEESPVFMGRYGKEAVHLQAALAHFSPQHVRDWCADLGEPTFVGTSGRVFPKSFKTSPLLRAWLRRLDGHGVRFALRHSLQSWSSTEGLHLQFATPEGVIRVQPDAVIFALGGASWPRLGADGSWVPEFQKAGLSVAPFQPANCGFMVPWSEIFAHRFAGTPLKAAEFRLGDHVARGEAMVTAKGLEGGAIYALSRALRDEIAAQGKALLHLDLKPDLTHAALVARLGKLRAGDSRTSQLRKLGLSPVAIGLLREAVGRDLPVEAAALAQAIKQATLRLTAPMSLDRAISSAGGLQWSALTPDLMLQGHTGVFACGEMLDWEAPTGGYLLQACFSTGAWAADGVRRFLATAWQS